MVLCLGCPRLRRRPRQRRCTLAQTDMPAYFNNQLAIAPESLPSEGPSSTLNASPMGNRQASEARNSPESYNHQSPSNIVNSVNHSCVMTPATSSASASAGYVLETSAPVKSASTAAQGRCSATSPPGTVRRRLVLLLPTSHSDTEVSTARIVQDSARDDSTSNAPCSPSSDQASHSNEGSGMLPVETVQCAAASRPGPLGGIQLALELSSAPDAIAKAGAAPEAVGVLGVGTASGLGQDQDQDGRPGAPVAAVSTACRAMACQQASGSDHLLSSSNPAAAVGRDGILQHGRHLQQRQQRHWVQQQDVVATTVQSSSAFIMRAGSPGSSSDVPAPETPQPCGEEPGRVDSPALLGTTGRCPAAVQHGPGTCSAGAQPLFKGTGQHANQVAVADSPNTPPLGAAMHSLQSFMLSAEAAAAGCAVATCNTGKPHVASMAGRANGQLMDADAACTMAATDNVASCSGQAGQPGASCGHCSCTALRAGTGEVEGDLAAPRRMVLADLTRENAQLRQELLRQQEELCKARKSQTALLLHNHQLQGLVSWLQKEASQLGRLQGHLLQEVVAMRQEGHEALPALTC